MTCLWLLETSILHLTEPSIPLAVNKTSQFNDVTLAVKNKHVIMDL